MHRVVDHTSQPIMGYGASLSAQPGERLGFHVSSALAHVTAGVLRLDRVARPAMDWPVQPLSETLAAQSFGLGSWLEVPVAAAGGLLSFDLLLTVNPTERVLFATATFECRYLPEGCVRVTALGLNHTYALTLPANCWLRVAYAWDAAGQQVTISAAAQQLYEQRLAWPAPPLQCLKIATDWDEQLPTLNARVANIELQAQAQTSHWIIPILRDQPILDTAGIRGPLTVRGAPTWAVCGPAWNGDYHDPRGCPEHYAALHLHEDDKAAFDWPLSFTVAIPEQAQSGVYALQLSGAQTTAQIIFVLLPARRGADLVFILPTMTYQAYANEALPPELYPWQVDDVAHRVAQQNHWLSLYDTHADSAGVSLATWPCPWLTMRDDYLYPLSGGPHGLPIDLHMLRFFAEQGLRIDVLTDHDLHRQPELLDGYSAVLTGSHPEYWTAPMLDALDAHLAGGASLAYLGGNGFYWVSALDHHGTLEVRRGQRGVRTWESAPGENHLSMTGELGGLWRWRGRAEHRLLGVGTTAMGFTQAQPYQRTPASYSAEWAWLFDGVSSAEIDADSLLLGGAAGYEIDRTSAYWGTPATTVVLASAQHFDSGYEVDSGELQPCEGPRRRADLCVRRTAAGGLVFAVGSVCWGAALPVGSAQNSVGLVTLNVLRGMSR